jgi:hypothetical protein
MEKMDLRSDPARSTTTTSASSLNRKVIRDDDLDDDFSDLEPELVNLNRTSAQAAAGAVLNRENSDTEADFLDCEPRPTDRNKDLGAHASKQQADPTTAEQVLVAEQRRNYGGRQRSGAATADALSNQNQLEEEVLSSDRNLYQEKRREKKSVEKVLPKALNTTTTSKKENRNKNNNQEIIDPVNNSLVVVKTKKKKSSVSLLIARFEETTTSTNPKISEQSVSKIPLRATRSVTPDKTGLAQASNLGRPLSPRPKSAAPAIFTSVLEEVSEDNDSNDDNNENRDKNEICDSFEDASAAAIEAANNELPLGAEAVNDHPGEDNDDEDMPRRNGYTSYVLIGAAANDETASIHSSASTGSGTRVVVNVSNGVVLQDGRASNISIVSTESSDLGSPPAEDQSGNIFEPVPDIPAKIRTRNGGIIDQAGGPDMQYFVSRDPVQRSDYGQRSRGGGGGDDEYLLQDEVDPGLSNYYTSALESSPSSHHGGPSSRRGRPPVIRAAERVRRQQQGQGGQPLQDENGEIIVEYIEAADYPDQDLRITEVGPNGEHYEVYTDEMLEELDEDDYDVRYESEEHSGDEEYVDNQDYPMCQPVQYDSEEYISEGDEYFDREEELRGYNRQIDFTLHTILEESCEDSDVSEPVGSGASNGQVEHKKINKRHSDPSEMEKYFLYGVGGRGLEEEEDESSTGTSSPDEVLEDDILDNMGQYHHHDGLDHEQEPQSMIVLSDQRNTDDSGSVGSESDGQRTPDPKISKKKVVMRSKGSRLSSDLSENGMSQSDEEESASSGSMKRNKKRRGSASDLEVRKNVEQANPTAVAKIELASPSSSLSPKVSPPITPLPSQIIEVQPALEQSVKRASPASSEEFQNHSRSPKSTSPTNPSVIRKHKSRDSGFVGSMDDLLRNENGQLLASHTSSDSTQSLSDGENAKMSAASIAMSRLEKVSEVSGEDDNATASDSPKKNEDKAILSRVDSFNNWSSDEDTNIMMNRMRAFFKTFLAGQGWTEAAKKPPQIQAFEAKLTKMMRTVPGINEEQVKELVEYLSSEDTWSDDTYDSSDYTSASDQIGLEAYGLNVNNIKDEDLENGQELQKETALMYSKLMAKMQHNTQIHNQQRSSPPIAAKVMAHISTKLVALMHDVSGSDDQETGSSTSFNNDLTSRKVHQEGTAGPPSRRYRPPVSSSKELSQSFEGLDTEQKSTFEENELVDVWQGAHRGAEPVSSSVFHQGSGAHAGQVGPPHQPRRGSLGLGSAGSSSSGQVSDLLNDDERWSWKGSFESTLAMEAAAKNKKAADLESSVNSSVEQIVDQQPPTTRVTSARFKPSMVVDHPPTMTTNAGDKPKGYSTSSLPRLGTSSIKKQAPPTTIETSEATLELSVAKKTNIATSANVVPPRSARYRPHGYRPPPSTNHRKTSPTSRKSSVDSVSRYTGRASC